ncbi:MAG: TonB-dependent receptor [Sphingobacteriales bacterium]|nr:TonB-dependent receptor [Sphingobacteriales bacterium]
MKKILCMLVACCMSLQIYAQNIPVTGKVVDETGEPLIGASVKVKGSNAGVSTNVDGKFSLSAPAAGVTLVISYLGYVSKEAKATDNLNIVLVKQDNNLQEVVVIGYGTQKRANLTGAVSAITNAELTTTKNESVTNMLTGKLPGVRIVQKSAEPGAFNQQFDIRGFGSPLIVIDGIPRDRFERLDPNDIESISVLKDAGAAVYGVRAANGVVLITTKKGKAGSREIRYEVTTGIQRSVGSPDLVGAIDWMTLRNEYDIHDADLLQTTSRSYSSAAFDEYRNGTKTSSDWYTPTIRRNAPQTQHSLTATGGNSDVTYYLSLGYYNQGSFYQSDDYTYNKYNLRSNVSAKIAKGLVADFQLSGFSDLRDQPQASTETVFTTLYRQNPTYPIYINNDPTKPAYSPDLSHPIMITDQSATGYRKDKTSVFQSNFSLGYDIPWVKGLKAKTLFAYDLSNTDNKSYSKVYNLYTASGTTVSAIPQGIARVSRDYGNSPGTTFQASLNYDHSFNSVHNVSALALYEERNTKGDNFNAQRDLIFNGLDQLGAGLPTNQVGTQNINGVSDIVTKGFVTKLHYDFKSKYLVDLISRYDGSSKFSGSNQTWGFFPAALAAWRISEEGFIKNTPALSFIDNLKLRASYGIVGDDGALNYQFLTGYDYPLPVNTTLNGVSYSPGRLPSGAVFDGNFIGGTGFRGLPNTQITWYESKTLDFGLDGQFWKGLFGFEFDWFRRDRDGLLATRLASLPGSVGANLSQENLESDRSQGVELTLTHNNKFGQVNFHASGNVSYTRNYWLYRERAPQGNSFANWRNNPNDRYKNIWFGLEGDGQFQSFEQIYSYPIDNSNGGNRGSLPGDYIYKDWNGDGYITDADYHPIASTYDTDGGRDQSTPPNINFGLNLGVNYKGFDLDVLLQGAAMRSIQFDQGTPLGMTFPYANSNALAARLDRWHPTDPLANPYDPNTAWESGYYAYTRSNPIDNSTFWIQNGAYGRLKTLTLGYTLPKSVTKKAGIQKARIYVNGYNLFTVTGIDLVDPEHPSDQNSQTYPMSKTYNMGVSVTF